MFNEKFTSFDLQQHQNFVSFQQNFDICQFDSITFDFIVKNLFEMFNKKFKKKVCCKIKITFFSKNFFKSIANYDLF